MIMGKLSGRVALITGGAGGIGRAIGRALAAEGADIGVIDRNAQGAKAVAEEITSLGVRTASAEAVVSDEAQGKAAFASITKTLGDIDIVIAHPRGWLVQAGRGIGFPWRVRRMASMARIERRRAVSTTERMSA